MKRLLPLMMVLAAACGGGERSSTPALSKTPVSVRGWIADVEGASKGETQTPETEGARLTQLFQSTSVWIENASFVSGGVAETGAFILLDVPPGNVTISFNAPGAETAMLTLEGVPGNADVLVPALMLRNGGARLLQPQGVRVRVPAQVKEVRPTGRYARIAGVQVPIVEAPLAAFSDRRDYPERGVRPLAIVR